MLKTNIREEEWSPRAIFAYCVKHLRKQKQRCKNNNNGNDACVYRDGDCKCAYGAFIPDEDYIPAWDETNADCLDMSKGLSKARIYAEGWRAKPYEPYIAPPFRKKGTKSEWASDAHKDLAIDLQRAHDGSVIASSLNSRLVSIQERFGMPRFRPILAWRSE